MATTTGIVVVVVVVVVVIVVIVVEILVRCKRDTAVWFRKNGSDLLTPAPSGVLNPPTTV